MNLYENDNLYEKRNVYENECTKNEQYVKTDNLCTRASVRKLVNMYEKRTKCVKTDESRVRV